MSEAERREIIKEQFVVVKYMDFIGIDYKDDEEYKSTKNVKYVLFNL